MPVYFFFAFIFVPISFFFWYARKKTLTERGYHNFESMLFCCFYFVVEYHIVESRKSDYVKFSSSLFWVSCDSILFVSFVKYLRLNQFKNAFFYFFMRGGQMFCFCFLVSGNSIASLKYLLTFFFISYLFFQLVDHSAIYVSFVSIINKATVLNKLSIWFLVAMNSRFISTC